MIAWPAKSAAFVWALVALALPAQAQSPESVHAEAPHSLIPAGDYEVEAAHTHVSFGVNYLGLAQLNGEFVGTSGRLTLDPDDPEKSRLDIVIPASSVETPFAFVTSILKSSEWLDTDTYPTMVFHSTRVIVTGPETADVVGLLTMHGETRPIVLKAQFNGTGIDVSDSTYTVGFTVSGVLSLSDFDVSSILPLVGDQVTLNINAAFEKK
jgi:polyisoprenoid-binding protein YceI